MRAGVGALSLGLLALELFETLYPSRQFQRPVVALPATWSVICGPVGYPGLPYINALLPQYFGPLATPPDHCGLGGQAVSDINNYPTPFTSTVRFYYGPNQALLPVERYFVDQTVSGSDPITNPVYAYSPPMIPMRSPTYVRPPVSHTLVPVVPMSTNYPPLPWPQAGTQAGAEHTLGEPVSPKPATNAAPGGLSYGPRAPDTPPDPREREKKFGGKAAAAVFGALQQFGNWNGMVYALWKALPEKYRSRRPGTHGRIRDLWRHWDKLDGRRAVDNLAAYYAGYLAGRVAYGRVQAYLIRTLGPDRGWRVYRAMVNAGVI